MLQTTDAPSVDTPFTEETMRALLHRSPPPPLPVREVVLAAMRKPLLAVLTGGDWPGFLDELQGQQLMRGLWDAMLILRLPHYQVAPHSLVGHIRALNEKDAVGGLKCPVFDLGHGLPAQVEARLRIKYPQIETMTVRGL